MPQVRSITVTTRAGGQLAGRVSLPGEPAPPPREPMIQRALSWRYPA